MLDKPTTLPKFAELDQIDPTSGKNNVAAPNATKQNYGWIFKEKPPRNHFNWLHRWTYRWLKWTDDTFKKGTVAVKLVCGASGFSALGTNSAGTLVGTEIHFDMEYRVYGDIVYLIIPYGPAADPFGRGVFGLAIDAPPTSFKIEMQSGPWPDDFTWASRHRGYLVYIDDDAERIGWWRYNQIAVGSSLLYLDTIKPLNGGYVGISGQVLIAFNYPE